MDSIMNQVIDELRERRLVAGVSIGEIARRMGTDRARISEIENGRGGLTLKRLYQYAEALGLSVTINFK
jgi:transcriptional regulator with XRE-family HTH domain